MIGILGAGSLGRLWAASLPAGQAGYLPRPGTPARALSYQFTPFDGPERTISLPAIPAENVTLLLVTTKAYDTLTALGAVMAAGVPPATPIVLFQNGLGSQQAVADAWPERPILAASTTEGAYRPSPDSLVHAGRGDTWVGTLTAPGAGTLTKVVQQLASTGLSIHASDRILDRLWDKLVVNAGINPFTALLDCPNGDLPASGLYQRLIDPLCGEIAALRQADTGEPVDSAAVRARIEAVIQSTARNTSSMRADMQQGRRTEIDVINGYLVRLGQRHGIPTPVNQTLTEQVQLRSPAPTATGER
ncbi:ketopantoate reductase family protein [Marinobacter sp. C2H3]|uniref:ketopantoate reductase family protein n=1 Tax=Marinobacter sp. C2H3 TaxID=3119003 RepID=UPI00300EF399